MNPQRWLRTLGLSIVLASTGACTAAATEDSEGGGLAATVDDSAARDAQDDLRALMTTDRDRVVEVEVHGSTHLCAVLSKASDLSSTLDLGDDDLVQVFVYREGAFAFFDGRTGGAAAMGEDGEELSNGLDAMAKDLRGRPTTGIQTQGVTTVFATASERVLAAGLAGLASMVRKELTQTLTSSSKLLKNPSTETAEAVAKASTGVSKWLSARLKTEAVGEMLNVAGTDWKAVVSKLTGLGVKTAYLGDDGAKKYLQAVAGDRTVMLMTHSGKLSDARLTQFPVLRTYFDRGSEFMPKILKLIANKEQGKLRVIGGGTLEGGQVPVYRAVSELQRDGVDVVADAVMAAPSAEYILAGKVAPVENVLVQGVEWGGESSTATLASKSGVLWGGGAQARDEALRLIAANKPVWVVRESAALKQVEGMPNAAAEVEAAARDMVAKGTLKADQLKNLHVFETWEELYLFLGGS